MSGTGTPIGITLPFTQLWSFDAQNVHHPLVGQLLQQLNATSIEGMLEPGFLGGLTQANSSYKGADGSPPAIDDVSAIATLSSSTNATSLVASISVETTIPPVAIDVNPISPCGGYNWELLYHIPVMIAVHLTSTQRFAEAQRWFHLVFDPTATDGVYWRSFAFNGQGAITDIATLLQALESPVRNPGSPRDLLEKAYEGLMADPFNPHLVARTRPGAYQWYVVMKYLDNLIAWGDSLFLQDTIETLNEATLCYVLAANLLGPQPQAMPAPGVAKPMTFRQLRQQGMDVMADALVELEAQFPFDLAGGSVPPTPQGALFGMSQALYFCIPPNAQLLTYWDTVADRLFKIRNSEDFQGSAQKLPLYDPPIDPGMLIKAKAAGFDIGSIVAGLNQPLGIVRSPLLIQMALELAGEVRGLGNAVLAAIEKGEGEQLALIRQSNEIEVQTLAQTIRLLQVQQAQETTNGLLKARDTALERYAYYLRLLGQAPDPTTAPPTIVLNREPINADNFNQVYEDLVGQYDVALPVQAFPPLPLADGNSPSAQSGSSSSGSLFLIDKEDSELNTMLPAARDLRVAAGVLNITAAALTPIPSLYADLHFWGLGVHSKLFDGAVLGGVAKFAADVAGIGAEVASDQGAMAARKAGYQRRADEWRLQANLAARELMQIGRQIIGALIAEQVATHEMQSSQVQLQQATDIQSFLQNKFTSAAFYGWLQSELSGLYYQYYRFACDTARRAEATMKWELMRPELDAQSFVRYNYWDAGHKGLLSGEALYLDVKRMQLAFHDNNRREFELVRHISLRQLDPAALVALRVTGQCTFTVPEWLFDMGCPGHYMRRIRTVGLSIPAVTGPYVAVNCTLGLQSSSIRTSPLLAAGQYARTIQGDDDRFKDSYGTVESIVTSGGTSDSGLFDGGSRDDRLLPFEGAGAIGTWSLGLPSHVRAFDYMTISDVILHMHYTARPAGDPLLGQATTELMAMLADKAASQQGLLLCLRYDFPTEWAAFLKSGGPFQATIDPSFFPYWTQTASGTAAITVTALTVYDEDGTPRAVDGADILTTQLATGSAQLQIPLDASESGPLQRIFLIIGFSAQGR